MEQRITYILDTHREELDRLGFQHRVWADDAHKLWHKAGFRAGQHLLDLGCGPGFASIDLAEMLTQKGKLMGVDASEVYINYAKQRAEALGLTNTEFVQKDLVKDSIGSELFDGIYVRWVFSWIKQVDEVMQKVAAALKPGGRVALQEYMHWGTFKLVPEHPAFTTMIEGCRSSWRMMESEIDVARILPQAMERAGLRIVHVAPLERTTRPTELTWQWPTGFLKIYSAQLIKLGLITPADVDAYTQALAEVEQKNSAFLVTPLMVEIIGEKR
jgi:ubiquinone/menaquinone biosynthesis C-methylase UbiE